jgi:hypothetical protein
MCETYSCRESRGSLGGVCPRERSWVGVPGGDPIRGRRFQRDNAVVNAAFEQLIDVASRRLKLRRLHQDHAVPVQYTPSSLSSFAMSVDEESGPTIRTAIGIWSTVRDDITMVQLLSVGLVPAFMTEQWRCHDRCSRSDTACRPRSRQPVGVAGPGPYGRRSRLLDPVRF